MSKRKKFFEKISLVITQNIKFFLIVLLISFPFWWGINILEKNLKDFLFWKMTQDISFKAQTSQPLTNLNLSTFKPLRNWNIEDLQLKAKSAISVEVTKEGKTKVLFEKASSQKLPIASLTKLMTAYLILENHHDLSETIKITPEMVNQEEEIGNLKPGEVFKIRDLLYMSLIESSNDAAFALASGLKENSSQSFVDLMNEKAEELGLKNTYFANPTGLDPDNPENPINYSTAKDLAKFAQFLLKKPFLLETSITPELDIYLANGIFHHRVKNTNVILRENLKWRNLIIGGKTGWTPRAGGCLLLILKNPKSNSFIINVILGSEDRFEEMKKLINWIFTAYKW